MIRKILYLNFSLCLIMLLTSCGWSEMSRNNRNIKKLNTGITKAQGSAGRKAPLRRGARPAAQHFAVYNTKEDVDVFIKGLVRAKGMLE